MFDSNAFRNPIALSILVLAVVALERPAAAIVVEFAAPNVEVIENYAQPDIEDPAAGTMLTGTVAGCPPTGDGVVRDWRDSDSGGAPDWAATGNVSGSSEQAWLGDSNASITTTTAVPSQVVAFHMEGDSNDGRAELFVDAVLVARIDMRDAGFNRMLVVVRELSHSTHVLTVDDIGPSNFGSGDDVAVFGASALGCAGIVELTWFSTTGAGVPGGNDIVAVVGDTLELDIEVRPDANALAGVSVSTQYDSAILDATSAEECPNSVLNPFSGACGASTPLQPFTSGAGSSSTDTIGDLDMDGVVGTPDLAVFLPLFYDGGPGIGDLDENGATGASDFVLLVQSYGAPGVTGFAAGAVQMLEAGGGTPTTDPMILGRIRFDAVAEGTSTLVVSYMPGIDGFVDGSFGHGTGYEVVNATVTVNSIPGVIPSLPGPAVLILCFLIALLGLRGIRSPRRTG